MRIINRTNIVKFHYRGKIVEYLCRCSALEDWTAWRLCLNGARNLRSLCNTKTANPAAARAFHLKIPQFLTTFITFYLNKRTYPQFRIGTQRNSAVIGYSFTWRLPINWNEAHSFSSSNLNSMPFPIVHSYFWSVTFNFKCNHTL